MLQEDGTEIMRLDSRRMRCGLWRVWLLFALLGLAGEPLSAQMYLFNKANFTTGMTPMAVVTGDFNGDGRTDLAVANNGSSDVTVLVNNGDGTFAISTTPFAGLKPVALGVGDFNGDGRLDLAVVDNGSNQVSILIGNGLGNFSTGPLGPPTGKGPVSVAVGDFDGDGKEDLAVVNQTDGTVSILHGNGDGTFTAKSLVTVGTSPAWIAVGDFNGDGKLDLAVVNSNCPALPCALGAGSVSIFFGKGDGTFTAQPSLVVGNRPLFVTTGDFNGDGKLDLAVANFNDNTVSVLLNNGNGTFGSKTDFTTGTQPVSVAAGDFNGDAKLDLAVTNQKDNTVSVLLNSGAGTFSAHVDYSTGTTPASMAAADLTGSGIVDLAVSNSGDNTVSVLLGLGNGAFTTRADITTGMGKGPLSVVSKPFRNNGTNDLAIANEVDNTVSILLGNGDGTFAFKQTLSTGASTAPVAIAVADFNGDGKLDLAVANQVGDSVSVFLGNGDGTFTLKSTTTVGTAPFSLTVGDFNGDGKQDLAVANSTSPGTVSILLGNGDGTFMPPTSVTVGNRPLSVVTADFNGDLKLDLAVANFNDDAVWILLGNGDGTFKLPTKLQLAMGSGPASIAVGDFNGDAKLDLAVADFGSTTGLVSILLGNGDGTFKAHSDFTTGTAPAAIATRDFNGNDFTTGTAPAAIATRDFNGDGKLDLAVAKFGASSVAVLLGNGNGTFQPHADYATGTNPSGVALEDFTGHGETDIAVANRDSNSVSIYLNLPILAFFPTSLSFGNQTVGTTSASQTVTLSNPGSVPFSVTGAGITPSSGTGFAVTGNTCGSTAPGATCTISVSFTPPAAGLQNATLSITDNVQGSPQPVTLSGTGTVPGASLLPASLAFGTLPLGATSGVMTATLTNTGNAPLTINSTGIDDPTEFAQLNNCGASVNAGANCTFRVTFSPQTLGIHNATLTVTDNAPTGSQAVSLSGTGTGPGAGLSTNSLTFPAQIVTTTSSAQSVTLTNTGNAPLNITTIKASGDFALAPSSSPCPTPGSLAAGANCIISVTFTPTAGNTRTGALSIIDNAGNSPQMVNLTGTGEDFSVSATNASAAVTAGQTATYTVSIAPESGFSQPVALTCAGAPSLANCTVSPSSVTPSGTVASNVTVTVTTVASTSAFPKSPSRFTAPPLRLGPGARWLLGFIGLAMMLTFLGTRGQSRRRIWWHGVVVGLTALVWTACGGGSLAVKHSLGTPTGTYTLTVTGTYMAGPTPVQNSVKLTLKVN